MAAGREATAALLNLRQPPTAIFAFDDLMAIGAMEELRRLGMRVPEDVAVVGFDDIDLAAFVDPPLTTVAQPKIEMGRLAADWLLDMIETGRPPKNRLMTLTPVLVVRRSCGAKTRAGEMPAPDQDEPPVPGEAPVPGGALAERAPASPESGLRPGRASG
jgi:DNA-binding LacI/PurR family transcriptional regulator